MENFKNRMNKRGITDIFFFMIIVATIAIFIMILWYVVGQITTTLKNDATFNATAEVRQALNTSSSILTQLNYVFLVLFFGLLMGVLISAAMIDVSKVFIPVYIILLGIATFIGVILSYLYDQFSQNVDLASTGALLTFANTIMNHYVVTILVVGVLSMVLYFSKTSSGSSRI